MEPATTPIATSEVEERDETTATEAHDDPNELDCQLRRLRDMVDSGRVDEARVLIKELEQRWPESGPVQHFARVLAPPKVLPARKIKARRLDRERDWLREHAREYPGQWLAVLEDRLVAANQKLAAVMAVLSETPNGNEAVLWFQPGEPD